MVKMIKFYQEKLYTVKAGIFFNRSMPFTERMFFRHLCKSPFIAL